MGGSSGCGSASHPCLLPGSGDSCTVVSVNVSIARKLCLLLCSVRIPDGREWPRKPGGNSSSCLLPAPTLQEPLLIQLLRSSSTSSTPRGFVIFLPQLPKLGS